MLLSAQCETTFHFQKTRLKMFIFCKIETPELLTMRHWYSLIYCDILGEMIQQVDKMHPPGGHAASKCHLHWHSTPHWDFQLPPITVKKSRK